MTRPLLAVLLLVPLAALANERHIYECEFEPDEHGGAQGRIKVEWSNYEI